MTIATITKTETETVPTTASAALFQMQFAVQMLNVGRIETAQKCFGNAQEHLQTLIAAGH